MIVGYNGSAADDDDGDCEDDEDEDEEVDGDYDDDDDRWLWSVPVEGEKAWWAQCRFFLLRLLKSALQTHMVPQWMGTHVSTMQYLMFCTM